MPNMEMIQKRLQMLDDLQEELRKLRQDANEMLENDPEYTRIKEETDLIKEQVKEKKAQVVEATAYNEVQEKMRELRGDIKDQQEALSQELIELYKEEGVTVVETPSGEVKKLKFNVKLINA
jgi:ABC-type phosphate transport system auxiliary subunit